MEQGDAPGNLWDAEWVALVDPRPPTPHLSPPFSILHPRRFLRANMRRGGAHTCFLSALVLFGLLFAAAAASTPCSLPPARGPGGLLVSDAALPSELAALLPGTELLQDIEALAARLGERGEAPFALVRMWYGSTDVDSTDLAVVRTYVERGGLLVVMGGTNSSRLLNDLFGWEIVSYTPDEWWRALSSNVSGTCFDMEEIPVLERKEEPHFAAPTKLSSLPPEARSIYRCTTLIRNCHPVGPYSRPMPRHL